MGSMTNVSTNDSRKIAWKPGDRQVATTCILCGGPAVTTEAEISRVGHTTAHLDLNVCEVVRRNVADAQKKKDK